MASIPARAIRKLRKIALRKTAPLRSPIRAAIVGFGGIAPDHAEAYELSGAAILVAANDVRPLSLRTALDGWPFVRTYKNLEQMLRQHRPEIVSVCTWPQTHAEI